MLYFYYGDCMVADYMITGYDNSYYFSKKIVRYLGPEVMKKINEYVNNYSKRDFKTFDNMQDIYSSFQMFTKEFYSMVNEDEILEIRLYTGFIIYKELNNFLRDKWSYWDNGPLDDEKRKKYTERNMHLQKIFSNLPNLPVDLITYRGTDLKAFKSYGIEKIEDLKNLVGSFIFDNGFTSTSFLRDKSFFGRNLNSSLYNVEITYYIPKEENEGLPLIDYNLAYDNNEAEFLLESGNLSKVLDVEIKDNKAFMKVAFIPRKIYGAFDIELKNKQNNSVRKI